MPRHCGWRGLPFNGKQWRTRPLTRPPNPRAMNCLSVIGIKQELGFGTRITLSSSRWEELVRSHVPQKIDDIMSSSQEQTICLSLQCHFSQSLTKLTRGYLCSSAVVNVIQKEVLLPEPLCGWSQQCNITYLIEAQRANKDLPTYSDTLGTRGKVSL